jgi:tetratricopeptide (TPR) repeat protein
MSAPGRKRTSGRDAPASEVFPRRSDLASCGVTLCFPSRVTRNNPAHAHKRSAMTARFVACLLLLSMASGCGARTMSSQQCKNAIEVIKGAASQLRGLEAHCKGSGYFELASADEALRRGDLVAARGWVESGVKVADFDVLPFYELEFSINEASKEPEKNKRLAEMLMQRHPDAAAGYFLLGKYYGLSGSASEAIPHLEKAKTLRGEVAVYGANKLLVSAYWDVDRLADAAIAFDDAERAYHQIYNDWSLTNMAAASHFLSGNKDRAKAILREQLTLHPECASDKHVRQLATDVGLEGF